MNTYQDDNAFDDRKEYSPTEIIEAIKGGADDVYSGAILYGLSDLTVEKLAHIMPALDEASLQYKLFLLQVLTEASHDEPRLDYSTLGYAFLHDEAPVLRSGAIEMLEWDESLSFMQQLIELVSNDPVTDVKAAALKALGPFVLAKELGKLPESQVSAAQDRIYALWMDRAQDPIVRAKALEALAYAPYEGMYNEIAAAYEDEDLEMRISAIVAMGHTCDDQWSNQVLHELQSDNDEMRVQAAYAAGEIQIEEAVPDLIRALLDEDEDEEMKKNAIWSLGEIGGKEAIRTLNFVLAQAEENEDEGLYDLIEEAMANASMTSGEFTLMNFEDED